MRGAFILRGGLFCYSPRMHLTALPIYIAAAICEIAGCFAFWAWLRLAKPVWWIVPGICALIAFAWLLSRVDAQFAGRAYAAYGGIYILASMGWMWLVEGAKPDRWDGFGVMLCVIGALVILFGPRAG